MPWLVFAADAHPPGFPFAVADAGDPIVWCKREADARFLAEAEESAAEIAELADPGFDRLDEPRRRRIRVLVGRAATKSAAWSCVRPEAHPADFPFVITEEDEVIGCAKTPPVAAFVVEASAAFQDLAAVVITLAGRLRRRLRALAAP